MIAKKGTGYQTTTGHFHVECNTPPLENCTLIGCVALLRVQAAEWEEPESDLDDDDMFDLEGSDDIGENKQSWAEALLRTGLGGFLHGLTGTKVGFFRVS